MLYFFYLGTTNEHIYISVDAIVKMQCVACNSKLTIIEYQARSADEAQKSITTCSKCPLDASKFNKKSENIIPHIHMKRFQRYKQNKIQVDISNTTSEYWIMILADTFVESDTIPSQSAECYNVLDSNANLYRRYISGPWKDNYVRETSRTLIGPNTYIIQYSTATTNELNTERYSHFKYSISDTIRFDQELLNIKIPSMLMIKLSIKNAALIQQYLTEMYLKHYRLLSLKDYMSPIILGGLSSMSAKAYDASSVNEMAYSFSTKPDGERFWLTRIGIVWILSRRLINHSIIGWYIDNSISLDQTSHHGPIIDIEMLIGHPPILIDVLMDENGNICSNDRNRDSIWIKFHQLQNIFPYLRSVHAREFVSTKALAQGQCNTVDYPTDGIVALSHDGVDMIKLKSVKSIELSVSDDNLLTSADGKAMFQFTEDTNFGIGSIVEIRLSISNHTFEIHDILMRSDKITANTSDVISSIVDSTSDILSDTAVRTRINRWSDKIRLHLYSEAHKIKSDRRIILDIGTGRGQGLQHYMDTSDHSYILVEPDTAKCMMLQRALKLTSFISNPISIKRYIPSLKTGKMKYCIMNMTLQTIMDDRIIFPELSPAIKCVVASFSAHYITDVFNTFEISRIPFIGSCYIYDDIDIGESIANGSSISMTRIDEDTARVKWGTNQAYFEPTIDISFLPGNMTVTPALHIAEPDTYRGIEHMMSLCEHLRVLRTR